MPKRKPRDVEALRSEIGLGGNCAFTREELLEAIRRDHRFVVEEDDFGWELVKPPLILHLKKVRNLHQQDLKQGWI